MQTNNRAELAVRHTLSQFAFDSADTAVQAVARILEMDDQLDVPLQICSDSAYTIDGAYAGSRRCGASC